MAKNYTFAEVVKVVNEGTNMEAITDIGRRFPILLHKVTKIVAIAGDEFEDLASYMPDYLTANKVNSALKNASSEAGEDEDTDDVADDSEETKEDAAEWNENMSAKQLWDILGKAGKRKLAKSTKKADLIEACKQAFGGGASEDEEDNEDVETEDAAETNPYEGKSAMELFKECKKRGIKAEAKKPAKFYADLLIKDDAAADAEDESESDDWDEEEEKPAKPEKKEEKKPAKKAEKKEAADDDDDWDI